MLPTFEEGSGIEIKKEEESKRPKVIPERVKIRRWVVFGNPVVYPPIHSHPFSRIALSPTKNGHVGTIIQKGGERAPRIPPAASGVREFRTKG